ncbi:Flavorubredoxin [Desulfonauticus submarinus]|uniref:Flavorubredoxin n=1 Tax=Desulfonauticus submarinus TaxID=206665 RepID=A0A1H0F972_9BACT|nr:FprA family A-type flavoprotein [Desulfonauticus submarinus]SDN91186.1 Flavorubredoxin [Desulfonauticus submarinus]
MAVLKIKENVYWVGVIDWNLRNFHGYSLADKGTTYNAYLVLDEKITLFDTVPEKFKLDLYHQIQHLIKIEDIDYIVVNHVEPDHSGALPFIIEKAKPEKIFCSTMGKKALLDHYHNPNWPYEVVNNETVISLGKKSIKFMETRMLHWPDSMFSFIPEDKLLISNDGFGQNIASTERFDDEIELELILAEAKHYYANIILPYSSIVQKTLENVQNAGWDIDMIAPDHGLIWRSHLDKVINLYKELSIQKLKHKAVIVYDTMWQSTEKMAKAIAEGLVSQQISVKIMSLKSYHHSDVMGEVVDAAAIICGSPTHNNSMMPLMADFLTYMKGLKPVGRIGASFGSFGWSGEAPKHIAKILEDAKFELPLEPLKVKNVPTHETLAKCKEMGKALALEIKKKLS